MGERDDALRDHCGRTTRNWMRRLRERPSSVSLEAKGTDGPKPSAMSWSAINPREMRARRTAWRALG